MAEIIKMPRLSDTMEEGTVEAWYKKVGDKVAEGDELADIQTDKAVQSFESEFEGTLLHIGVEQGQTVKVDELLAIIGEDGEDISGLLNGSSSAKKEEKTENKTEKKEESSASSEEKAEEKNEEVEDKESSNDEIPDGVFVINMPRLSDTMEEGTVELWHKKVGEKVAEGDELADIQTDKAVQTFESEYEGTLLKIGVEQGETVKVDSLLAIIGPEGTDVSGIGSKPKKSVKPKEEKSEVKTEKTEEKSSEKVEKTEAKTDSKSSDSSRVFISPLAKKLAEEKGFNIHDIKGSGDNGRIVKKDVESFSPQEKSKTTSTGLITPMIANVGETQSIPHSQIRKVIAKRLAESKFTAPHYYLMIEVNMDNAIQARKQINEIPDTKISFNDIIVKAASMALRKHPQVNSTWKDDEMILHGDINIGVAVAVQDGLLVPVVKNTDHKSLSQIAAEVKDLATRSRDKQIKANEMEGSTFTVSNLGAYGIEVFTSIINQPNSCILSVGAIVEKPIVKNGQIVIGNTMKLSLACDHRTVDGATGSLYLQTLKQYLETPMAMMV